MTSQPAYGLTHAYFYKGIPYESLVEVIRANGVTLDVMQNTVFSKHDWSVN